MPTAPNIKSVLREQALQRRAAMTAEDRVAGALALKALFLEEKVMTAAQTVAGYWPVRGEADVLPLLDALRARGHAIALPCVEGRNSPLIFRLWDGECPPPVQGMFDIPEPAAGAAVVVPDIVLVPLAAFDGRGHRLGYGAGFYDRTLGALRQRGNVLAVGIAFAGQRVDFIPVEATDVGLDIIVTDKAVFRFDVTRRREGQE